MPTIKRYFTILILALVSVLTTACNKVTFNPELTFKANNTKVKCTSAEEVNCVFYPSQNIVSLTGNNFNSVANLEDGYKVKFIIENVQYLNDIVGISLPLQSQVNPIKDMYIRGYISSNLHSFNYEFTDIEFKITSINKNKMNGTFSGLLVSNADASTIEVTSGTFSDITIEDLIP